MPPEQWNRLKALFAEASELQGAERHAWLDRECEAALREQIEEMLRSHDRASGLIEQLQPPTGIVAKAAGFHAFRAGEIVAERYRINRLLGEGGMGEVYAAFDRELNEPVALKTLRSSAGTEEWLERFRREVQLARKVTHPNVCRIFDFGKHNDVLFLTMELIEGETLAARLKREGGMTPEKALPLVRQMAAALDAAHAAGIVHRDFKPGNIMLAGAPDASPRAVVTDFGLARTMRSEGDQRSTGGVAIGTPAYMSPEQIEGKPAGQAADIYAFGVVLYEMVTGELPYDSHSPLAMAAQKVQRLPQPPSSRAKSVDARWDAVILRCLAFDPDARFASGREAVEMLAGGRLTWRMRRPHLSARILPWAAAAALVLCGWLLVEYWPRENPETMQRLAEGEGAMADGAMVRARNLLRRGLDVSPSNAMLHARLAECLWELDSIDGAKDEALLAARARGSGEPYVEAMRLTVLRDFSGAAAMLRKRAAGAVPAERPRALMDLARAEERNEEPGGAASTYEEILKHDPQNGSALYQRGRLAERAQEQSTLEWLAKAERAFLAVGNYEGVAEATYERGVTLRNAGRTDKALTAFEQALDRARATDHAQLQVRCQYQLAALALNAGDAGRAEALVKTAAESAARAGQENLAVQGWAELGNVHMRSGRWSQAQRCYAEALEMARHFRSRVAEARALVSLASVAERMGRLELTVQYAGEAEAFLKQGGYRRNLSLARMLEARAATGLGDYRNAEQVWQQLMAAAGEKEAPQIALCEEGLGTVRFRTGKLTEARQSYQHAVELYTSMGQRDSLTLAQLALAEIGWTLGEAAVAQKLIDQARERERDLPINVKSRLAAVRMQFALSQRRGPEARLAGQDMMTAAATVRGVSLCIAAAHSAEAEALSGNRTRAGALRAQSLECASRQNMADLMVEVWLAASETSAMLGEDAAARGFAQQAYAAATRFVRREDAWHAALLLGPAYTDSATTTAAAGELRSAWGDAAWNTYCSRPDRSARTKALERRTQ